MVLRTSLPATLLEPQIRHEIQSIDPGLPVFNVSSMNDILDRSLASRRFSADLVGGFAGLAVLLASIGIYGLLAYMVSQRSREIGIRMALGAGRGGVLKLFLQKGIVLAGLGIVAGMVVSASTASLMGSLLYGVRPHDPAVFVIVPLLLFAVAVASQLSSSPARDQSGPDDCPSRGMNSPVYGRFINRVISDTQRSWKIQMLAGRTGCARLSQGNLRISLPLPETRSPTLLDWNEFDL